MAVRSLVPTAVARLGRTAAMLGAIVTLPTPGPTLDSPAATRMVCTTPAAVQVLFAESASGPGSKVPGFFGGVRDIAVSTSWKCELLSGLVECSQLGHAPLRLEAPDGLNQIALSGGAVWFLGNSTSGLKLCRQSLVSGLPRECADVSVPRTLTESAEFERASRVERELSERAILVASEHSAAIVFKMRDVLVECSSPSTCTNRRWNSPRSFLHDVADQLWERSGRKYGLPVQRVRSATMFDDGRLGILPSITGADPKTGSFQQRDQVLVVGQGAEPVKKFALPGPGMLVANCGGKLVVALDDGVLLTLE